MARPDVSCRRVWFSLEGAAAHRAHCAKQVAFLGEPSAPAQRAFKDHKKTKGNLLLLLKWNPSSSVTGVQVGGFSK